MQYNLERRGREPWSIEVMVAERDKSSSIVVLDVGNVAAESME